METNTTPKNFFFRTTHRPYVSDIHLNSHQHRENTSPASQICISNLASSPNHLPTCKLFRQRRTCVDTCTFACSRWRWQCSFNCKPTLGTGSPGEEGVLENVLRPLMMIELLKDLEVQYPPPSPPPPTPPAPRARRRRRRRTAWTRSCRGCRPTCRPGFRSATTSVSDG